MTITAGINPTIAQLIDCKTFNFAASVFALSTFWKFASSLFSTGKWVLLLEYALCQQALTHGSAPSVQTPLVSVGF